MTKTAFASSYGVLLTAHIPSGDGGIQRVWAEPEAVSTNIPASRASPVVIVLNLIVAKETDLIAALARPEVLVSHVHVLHTEWAACHGSNGFASDLMSDSHAGQSRIAMQERCWPFPCARPQGRLTITVVHRGTRCR